MKQLYEYLIGGKRTGKGKVITFGGLQKGDVFYRWTFGKNNGQLLTKYTLTVTDIDEGDDLYMGTITCVNEHNHHIFLQLYKKNEKDTLAVFDTEFGRDHKNVMTVYSTVNLNDDEAYHLGMKKFKNDK